MRSHEIQNNSSEPWDKEDALANEREDILEKIGRAAGPRARALIAAFLTLSASGCATVYEVASGTTEQRMRAASAEREASGKEHYVERTASNRFEFKKHGEAVYVFRASEDGLRVVVEGPGSPARGLPPVRIEKAAAELPGYQGKLAPRVKIFGKVFFISRDMNTGRLGSDSISLSTNPYEHKGEWNPTAAPFEIVH